MKSGWRLSLALVLLLLIVGCGGKGDERPEAPFATLSLAEAPPEIQQAYAELRALPGLVALQKEGETYLLVLAGAGHDPGLGLQVIDLLRIQPAWRVLVVMSPDSEAGEYPYTLVRLKAPPGTRFHARLSGPEGEIHELEALMISDR